jgi:hypothetical protein
MALEDNFLHESIFDSNPLVKEIFDYYISYGRYSNCISSQGVPYLADLMENADSVSNHISYEMNKELKKFYWLKIESEWSICVKWCIYVGIGAAQQWEKDPDVLNKYGILETISSAHGFANIDDHVLDSIGCDENTKKLLKQHVNRASDASMDKFNMQNNDVRDAVYMASFDYGVALYKHLKDVHLSKGYGLCDKGQSEKDKTFSKESVKHTNITYIRTVEPKDQNGNKKLLGNKNIGKALDNSLSDPKVEASLPDRYGNIKYKKTWLWILWLVGAPLAIYYNGFITFLLTVVINCGFPFTYGLAISPPDRPYKRIEFKKLVIINSFAAMVIFIMLGGEGHTTFFYMFLNYYYLLGTVGVSDYPSPTDGNKR